MDLPDAFKQLEEARAALLAKRQELMLEIAQIDEALESPAILRVKKVKKI
jgi:hypothetical protein